MKSDVKGSLSVLALSDPPANKRLHLTLATLAQVKRDVS